MQKLVDQMNELIGVEDSYQAPDRLLTILYDRHQREELFLEFLELFDYNVTYDWFHFYFQDEHAQRKKKKQDFTPDSVGELVARLTGGNEDEGTRYDPCSGTGGLTIKKWHEDRMKHTPFDYRPSYYLYHCEELSSRAIPFLLFNLLIRGMNAVVVHCDVLSRKADGAFFIQNDRDDHLQFSSLNLLPYKEEVERFLGVKWATKRYKTIVETKEIPAHLSHFVNSVV